MTALAIVTLERYDQSHYFNELRRIAQENPGWFTVREYFVLHNLQWRAHVCARDARPVRELRQEEARRRLLQIAQDIIDQQESK